MRIAVDVGGTFTDVIVLDEQTNTLRLEKVETTPQDPATGVLRSFEKASARLVISTTLCTAPRWGATLF